jgi:hypothetical protein
MLQTFAPRRRFRGFTVEEKDMIHGIFARIARHGLPTITNPVFISHQEVSFVMNARQSLPQGNATSRSEKLAPHNYPTIRNWMGP